MGRAAWRPPASSEQCCYKCPVTSPRGWLPSGEPRHRSALVPSLELHQGSSPCSSGGARERLPGAGTVRQCPGSAARPRRSPARPLCAEQDGCPGERGTRGSGCCGDKAGPGRGSGRTDQSPPRPRPAAPPGPAAPAGREGGREGGSTRGSERSARTMSPCRK